MKLLCSSATFPDFTGTLEWKSRFGFIKFAICSLAFSGSSIHTLLSLSPGRLHDFGSLRLGQFSRSSSLDPLDLISGSLRTTRLASLDPLDLIFGSLRTTRLASLGWIHVSFTKLPSCLLSFLH